MYRWLVVVGALAGCGDNSSGRPGVAGIRDGTRLVARYFVAEGAAVFRIWHDTERTMDCTFQPASDGEYRCLPTGLDARYAYKYADAACTHPVVVAARCQLPRYAFGREMATARCNRHSGRAVFAVGSARRSRFVFDVYNGMCNRSILSERDVAYELGDTLPATDFVAAQLGATTSDALAPYAFTADDGAIQADTAWDAVRGGECDVRGTSDVRGTTEPVRCTPINVAWHDDDVWAEAACSIHAAVDFGQNRPCTTPTAIKGYNAAGVDAYFREIGAPVPAADVHVTDDANACMPRPPAMTAEPDDYYLEGPVIPDDAFSVMSRVLDGGGRVRAERYTDAAGHDLAAAREFYDTLAKQKCTPYRFLDGTLRCIPYFSFFVSPPHGHGRYADAACTQPIALNEATSPPPPVIVVLHESRDACDAVPYDATHAAGPPHTGDLFYGRACTPLVRDPSLTYYTLGAAIELPLITEL